MAEGNHLTMQRLQVIPLSKPNTYSLCPLSDQPFKKNKSSGAKEQRVIKLDKTTTQSIPDRLSEEFQIKQIVGMAIQLIREL